MKIKNHRFFHGQWLVKYKEAEFPFQQIWIYLQQVDQHIQSRGIVKKKIYISFKKSAAVNVGRWMEDPATGEKNLHLTLRDGLSFDLIEDGAMSAPTDQGLNIASPIRTVSLFMPFLSSDPRWRKLELTSSALFLGSALTNRGFKVNAHKLNLPLQPVAQDLWNADLIGFTLFEDLLPQCIELLDQAPWQKDRLLPLLAAGGPLITLNPLQAAYHLPAINIFVRGEGDLVFAAILDAVRYNRVHELLQQKGFLLKKAGTLIMSDFHYINRPRKFIDFSFTCRFLKDEQLSQGLELNLSRGCTRSCLFCSKVQGSEVRKLPRENLDQLLNEWQMRVERSSLDTASAKTVNINDDDLLQEPEYAQKIFEAIKGAGFRLWGLQTSLKSFLDDRLEKLLELIDDLSLFVRERPLLWVGTDVFLPERSKRLGKGHFSSADFERIVAELEKRKIANYHYWISSDHLSSWQEFVEEFSFLHSLLERYKHFALLPNAPFVIPYSSTPLYQLLHRSDKFRKQIILKKGLKAPMSRLNLPLVARVETGWPHLNRLLANESMTAGRGFFDAVKERDYLAAYQTIFDYLKKDRLLLESEGRETDVEQLSIMEGKMINMISQMMV